MNIVALFCDIAYILFFKDAWIVVDSKGGNLAGWGLYVCF